MSGLVVVTDLRPPRRFQGLALVVATLRGLDPATRREIMADLASRAPEIARLAENCEFIFADFRLLDDASLFSAFNRFGDQEWAVAWKLTDEGLKNRVLGLLRDDRRKEFLDFAASQPKMPRTQVLAVQLHMARKARDLLRTGQMRMLNRLTIARSDARANSRAKLQNRGHGAQASTQRKGAK
jgi:flagellar motor switch protein FliG